VVLNSLRGIVKSASYGIPASMYLAARPASHASPADDRKKYRRPSVPRRTVFVIDRRQKVNDCYPATERLSDKGTSKKNLPRERTSSLASVRARQASSSNVYSRFHSSVITSHKACK